MYSTHIRIFFFYAYIFFLFIHYLCSTTSRTSVSVPLLLVGDKPFRIGLTLWSPDTSFIYNMFKPTRCKRKCVVQRAHGSGVSVRARGKMQKKRRKKDTRGLLNLAWGLWTAVAAWRGWVQEHTILHYVFWIR